MHMTFTEARVRKYFWLLPAIFLSCSVSAQVVKCRDAAGRLQFTDHCPSGWQKVDDVRTSGTPQTPSGVAPSWQQRETEFRIRQNDRHSKELAEQKDKELMAKECANARRRLEILEGGTPLITKGAFTKDPEYLEDSQRAREIERENRMLMGCR
jgi:hypothetical protein